ncbi:LysR family transcriptional regulator [Rhodovulum sp. FJ3]|uniref:LysR family transcriptional regulator n=1 Tax=Rhodovulum sp. FJ3 TaxID=3079053 RepID=UPI00293DF2A8|nr:LysR substrate-binding domain-containing protein [Rhodovulum sp. FJ3]MDV4169225.1 LysR substrate-binding domain-containing protein [Rhodovulum sp. FJ3]
MPMDLARRLKPNQLQLLLRVAETGQLQQAAHMTAMSQPAASRILGDVETLVGSPLFLRHPKGMEPTLIGKVFIRHAKIILESLDELETETRRFSTGDAGHVRIGAVTGPAVGCLMPAVRQIKAETPDVELTIEVGPSTELVRGLRESRFDFVISRLPPEYDSRDFKLHPARSEQVSLLAHPDHDLVERSDISLTDTLDYEWVIQELGSPIRQAVEAAFLQEGLQTPQKVTNSSSLLVVLSLLENTGTIAPQSREVAAMLANGPLRANIAVLDIATPISVSPCFIIENRFRPPSKAAERVLSAVYSWL